MIRGRLGWDPAASRQRRACSRRCSGLNEVLVNIWNCMRATFASNAALQEDNRNSWLSESIMPFQGLAALQPTNKIVVLKRIANHTEALCLGPSPKRSCTSDDRAQQLALTAKPPRVCCTVTSDLCKICIFQVSIPQRRCLITTVHQLFYRSQPPTHERAPSNAPLSTLIVFPPPVGPPTSQLPPNGKCPVPSRKRAGNASKSAASATFLARPVSSAFRAD